MVSKTKKTDTLHQEDLFINLEDSQTKRKNLLLALKNSLLVQEEATKLKNIREEKILTQKEIKKNIDLLNQKYQELKKKLPNVKTSLTMTQKELDTLESHIDTLKKNVHSEREHIKEEEELKKELEKTQKGFEEEVNNAKKTKVNTGNIKEEAKKTRYKSSKDIPKIDRIRNNLSIIEKKLKDM